MPKGERIARRLARAGLCSRREAERWIEAGRVSVDGKTLDTPAFTVTAASRIIVDGKPLPDAEPAALWRYHKPGGLVTTNRDPQGRTTIFERLPAGLPRVVTVGRLDLTTEGLLLLTNDGALARHLELPSTGWSRRYRVRVHGAPDQDALKALGDGITISGIHYGPITARLDRQQGSNAWLSFVIREGKNREIRRVCEHLGLTVNRLIRIGYGPFELGDLATGAVAQVPARILRDQLGTALPEIDFGSTDTPAAGKQVDRAPAKGRLALKGKPSAKDRPPAKGRPGAGRPNVGKRPFGDRPARTRDPDSDGDRRMEKPFRPTDGPARGKRPIGNIRSGDARPGDTKSGDTGARDTKPGAAKRPFGDRNTNKRFRSADGPPRAKHPDEGAKSGDTRSGGNKSGAIKSAGSKRRFSDRPAGARDSEAGSDRRTDRPFRAADGPAQGKHPDREAKIGDIKSGNAKSAGSKRRFGDRTVRAKDSEGIGDRQTERPFRAVDGSARSKGPDTGGKPGGAKRPERGGKTQRRIQSDAPQAKRDGPTPHSELQREPRRDYKSGPKKGPKTVSKSGSAKPGPRNGPGRPKSSPGAGAPAATDSPNPPTGRTRGSARRRKTLDANRRRTT